MAMNDPKSLWREIYNLTGVKPKQGCVNLSQFYDHFNQIYCKESDFRLSTLSMLKISIMIRIILQLNPHLIAHCSTVP